MSGKGADGSCPVSRPLLSCSSGFVAERQEGLSFSHPTGLQRFHKQVEDELKQHLSQESGKDFTRHGKMAIFYNGDHYHLRINAEGRLVQFHVA